jgi:uncharacterized protein with NRDE domain
VYRLLHPGSPRLPTVCRSLFSADSITPEISDTLVRILASNRDEYLDRPTTPAAWHAFEPIDQRSTPPLSVEQEGASDEAWVLSGRDAGSPAGGTWLGMTSDLRIGVMYVRASIGHALILTL